MSDFTFDVNYDVGNGDDLEVSSVAISPTPPGKSKTGSDGDGNITVGKGDKATFVYNCGTAGWNLSELQLKSQDRRHWGKQSGKKRLNGDAAEDFPDVDADSGTVTSNGGAISISDVNKKSSTVDYRVAATNGSKTIWSDPRVKNNGD